MEKHFCFAYCNEEDSTCGWGIEYAHRFPASCMRRMKRCPDGSASTSVGLHWSPVQPLPGCRPKTLPTFPNLSCPIPSQPLLQMLLTGLHHSTVVSIPLLLLLPSKSSIFPLHFPPLLLSLMCTRVRSNYHHHQRRLNTPE